MNTQKKNKPSYSFKNIKRDSSERFLILGVSEYRRWIPRKTNMILGLSKWDTSIPWQSSFSFRSLWCGYIWTQSLVCSENKNNHTRLVMKYIFISYHSVCIGDDTLLPFHSCFWEDITIWICRWMCNENLPWGKRLHSSWWDQEFDGDDEKPKSNR